MARKDVGLIVLISMCIGSLTAAQGNDPNQYDYTVPARQKLFGGTLSGLIEGYQILQDGMNDPTLTGDKRELIFLHALARAGMLVFDRDDVAINTSLLEIVEPFGVTVTGDKFFPENPEDPDRIEISIPIDPCDPNGCYEIPPGIDTDAADDAVNNTILPEINAIVAQLDSITDSPQDPFRMYFEPNETGLLNNVEVDYAEVLALQGLLKGAKAALRGLANPAYDIFVNPYTSPFGGSICDVSYEINAILSQYPDLLKVLPTPGQSGDGPARLAQAKQDLIAGIDAYFSILNHIKSETDPQQDDLLYIDPNAADAVDLWSQKLSALRQSLQQDAPATYPWLTTRKYNILHNGAPLGQMTVTYDATEYDIETGWLQFSNPSNPGSGPVVSRVQWGEKYNSQLMIEFDHHSENAWLWGMLEGTLTADNISITAGRLSYTGQWDGAWVDETLTGISGQLTDTQVVNAVIDLNPIFGGTARYPNPVNPRDLLPQYDPNNEPVPRTFGHGLGNDAALGGILPNMTQEDWIPRGYEVWGVSADCLWMVSEDGPQEMPGCVCLGQSEGQTATFSGGHQYYAIATLGRVQIDSIRGSDGQYYTGPIYTWNASNDGANITGATDGRFDTVGHDELLGAAMAPKEYTGLVGIENPGAWTGLTVITDIESMLHDWNGDGIVSIVGDVPPFVDCVYFGNCPPDYVPLCDCNGDGICSIIGDVPCFVDCVYFGNCGP